MPPLESKKLMFRMVAGVRGQRRKKGLAEVKLMFIDVRKAHLNAVCEEEEWVQLPEEFWEHGRYARLKRWLYGMRKAAAGWEEDYAKRMVAEGFKRGRGAPTVFYNQRTEVRVVVHGDDFTFSGTKVELDRMRRKMEEWYDIKDRGMMGSGEGEIKEVTILGRTVRWTNEGIEYEADAEHRAKLMKVEGLEEDSKVAVGPAVKDGGGAEALEEVKLEGDREHKEFRSKGGDFELPGAGQERHPVRGENDLPRDVDAHGRRKSKDKEGGEVLGGSKEVGVEVWGKGGG